MVECAKRHGHNPEAWLTDVLERPQLWMNDGKPAVLFCAVAADGPRKTTFNVAMPIHQQHSP